MKKIKCPICDGFQTKELFKVKDYFKLDKQNFSIRKCKNCKIVFTYPQLSRKEVEKFYPEINLWSENIKAKNRFVKFFRYLEKKYFYLTYKYDAKRLSEFIGTKRSILDIGCGTGVRLESFKQVGFNECHGLEPSKRDANEAKSKGFLVKQTTLDKSDYPENSFDIVTLYHVLEHLDSPVKHLKIIRKILRPNGDLVIQVPNFDSWQARIFKGKWTALSIPLHYFHFTPQTINSILDRSGFKTKKIDLRFNIIRPHFWGLAFSNITPHSIWKKENKGEKAIFHRIILILLVIIFIIPTLIEAVFNKGGHMTIYAKKKL